MAHSRYDRGTRYACTLSGVDFGDFLTGIGVGEHLAADLPVGPDLHKCLPLWNAPEL